MHDSAGRSSGASVAIPGLPASRRGRKGSRRTRLCLLLALLAAACIAPASARDTKPEPSRTMPPSVREPAKAPRAIAPNLRAAPERIAPGPAGTTAPAAFAPAARTLYSCCLLNAVAAADLNGDGRQDIVTGNGVSYDFSVLLATGPDSFAEAVNYPVGTPEAGRVVVAAGDIDEDGDIDIVATGTTFDALAWLYPGDGEGGFGAAREFSLGSAMFAQAIEVADVNGDGHLDIVTANGGTANVSVLLGNGSGGFAAVRTFAVPQGPEGLAVGDADGDGHADIVTTGRTDFVVAILAGDGSGEFAAATELSVGRNADPFDVTIADIDGDGDRDLVTSNAGSDGSEFPPIELPGSVSLLRSDGQGGFAAAEVVPLDPTPGRAHAVVVADVTADGHPDIIVSQTNGNAATVLVGDGSGGFGVQLVRPTGVQPSPLAIADVTGDGHPDIITGNTESVSILPTDGDGGVGFDGRFAAGAMPFSILATDVNGDQRPDVLTADSISATMTVLLNDGEGGVAAAGSHAVGANPTSIATGDLDGDGHLDAVVADLGGGTVSVLLGDGAGGFAPATPFPIGEGFQSPYAVALGDANGDGHLDVATANVNISNESISVLLGDGDGGLGAAQTHRVGPNEFNSPQGVAMADVTGDGHADIVTANIGSSSLSLLAGDGTGDFADAQLLTAGDGPVMVVAGDVNGDGRTDLISLNHTGQSVSVLAATGAGQFAPAQTYAIAPEQERMEFKPWPWGIVLGDVNGDGHPDIVTANTQNDTVSVLVNDGDGAFPQYLNYGAGARPGAAAIADIDGDGRADVITANRDNNDVSVLFATDGSGFADLALAVAAAPGNVSPGETMTFIAAVANGGPAVAGFPGVGFAFDAALPDLEIDAPGDWSCDAPDVGGGATSIACTTAALAAGEGATFLAFATAPGESNGDVITMAAATTSTTQDPVAGNNSDSVAVSVDAASDLAVAISGPPVFVRGTVASYAIALENLGPAPAPQASLEVAVDVPVQSVEFTAAHGWTCAAQASSRYRATCTRAGTVAAGEATFTAAVTVGNRLFPPRIVVRARAASAADDPDPSDNAATLTSRLGRAP